MKINDIICGFKVIRTNNVSELSATLFEMEHEKTGAKLAYLERDDSNMSFAIAFSTPPEDDTGAFHIIEHSVLCGSEKYPLRDPFAELLKGSLNTFLNALTYEDRTVYPVSSRCEKDFLNLVDVYLDAVLNPNLVTNPNIFRQEGWHYEYDSGTLTRSGVVYNEMKGAYSSPDDLALAELNRVLFPNSSYGKDSGGAPAAIPTLTYEKLLELYNKYYHPSNARIFIDGSLPLEKVLGLIDSHISRYEKKDIKVVYGKSEKVVAERKISYEVSDGDDDKARVLFGYVFSDFSDKESLLATTLISDYLCGSNASPLKRELLERGLCRDVMMYTNKNVEQTVVIEVRDTNENKVGEIVSAVNDTIRCIADEGFDKEAVRATLDHIEFKLRERDYGSFPRGVEFALSAFADWIYGGAPEDALMFEETVKSLREKIDGDYLEKTLLSMTLDNDHKAMLTMIPDPALAASRAAEEELELAKTLAAMSEEELDRIKQELAELKEWQNTDESEALAYIPSLEISDIPEKGDSTPTEVYAVDGAEVIYHNVKTDGIVYLTLFVDASDTDESELHTLSLLASALTNLNTKRGTALELQNRIKANLGSFSVTTATSTNEGETRTYLRISASALDSKKKELESILNEVLFTSDFENEKEIENLVAQTKSAYEDAVVSSGHSVALQRLEAYSTTRGAVIEHLSGYEFYLKLKELLSDKTSFANLTKALPTLLGRILTKGRITLSVAGDRDEKFVENTVSMFKEGKRPAPVSIAPFGARREFILAPAKVAYAVRGASILDSQKLMGEIKVARSILSYEYLWNTVRVSGGAYGAGFIPRRSGLVAFYSYRDPSPARSIDTFAKSSDYLRKIAEDSQDLTKFIIGAFGEYDILTTPRTATAQATWNYMNGFTDEMAKRERLGILNASKDSLMAIASIIDKATDIKSICIVGGEEHLATCKNTIDNVLVL